MDPRKMEKRRAQRANVRFVVAYDAQREESGNVRDVSQTKNLSSGGMLLTTSKEFDSNTRFLLKVRLPTRPEPLEIDAQVLESHQSTPQVFDTRVQFIRVEQQDRQILSDTVSYFLRKEHNQN